MDIGWPHIVLSSGGGSLVTYAVMNLVPAIRSRLERKNGNGNGHYPVCQAETMAVTISRQTDILERLSRNQEDQGKILSMLANAEERRQQQEAIVQALRANAVHAG